MTEEQKHRYSRQLRVNEIGESEQERLLCSKVAIVGCGALGSMVAMQLAGAGVGTILIADFDTIDLTNLQRQLFFQTKEVGEEKSRILSMRINGLNPSCKIEIVDKKIDRIIAKELFKDCDFIIDATDNLSSKIMIEKVSSEVGKTCCIGGVSGFHGQVMTVKPGGVTFGEICCVNNHIDDIPSSPGGVMGPAPALCASIQASEAIKYITQIGELLESKMIIFDLLSNKFSLIKL